MPEPMTEGMNLDPTVLIAVQNERIAAGSIREAQLTAAVQQLTMQVMELQRQLEPAENTAAAEDEDASADDGG